MKAQTIKTLLRINAVFPALKEEQAPKRIYVNESVKVTTTENVTEFQRQPYIGSFFAGAHAIVDPRFFK